MVQQRQQAVDVTHNDEDTTTHFPESVFYGNTDVVKRHICSASSGRIACLDLLRLDTRTARDEEDSQTVLYAGVSILIGGKDYGSTYFGPDTRSEVVSKGTIGYPLLTACVDGSKFI